MDDSNLSALIWPVADLPRGDFRQSDYGKVILPFTLLRRLDCVLEKTKPAVLAEHVMPMVVGRDLAPSVGLGRSLLRSAFLCEVVYAPGFERAEYACG